MPTKLKFLLPLACCLILANLYYAQPIIASISDSIGLPLASAGVIVTAMQIGYCLGVFILVPLVDFVENRKLITLITLSNACALVFAGQSTTASTFLAATLIVGFTSSCAQIIIPFTVSIADKKERGKMAGLVISGGILGLVLARPVSSFLASLVGWHFIYNLASALMFAITLVLYRALPTKVASGGSVRYSKIFKSMWSMLTSTPGLKPRLFIMSSAFATFSISWATIPLMLQQKLGFSHTDVALFSLISLITPFFSTLAGRLVDRGYSMKLTFISITMIALGYLSTPIFGLYVGVFMMMIALSDPGVNMLNIVIQQAVLAKLPESMGRANALCIAFTFAGGAIGSAVGPWLYSHYGWWAAVTTGIILMGIAYSLTMLLLKKGNTQ